MNKHLVIKTEINEMTGVYGPFTLNGDMIVNNIISSCYAKWVVDDLIGSIIDESYLPTIYHCILSPFRLLYQVNG